MLKVAIANFIFLAFIFFIFAQGNIKIDTGNNSVEPIIVADSAYYENSPEIIRENFLDVYNPKKHDRVEEIRCLAKNIYFETRGEAKIEQIAVGMVTKNRVMSGEYADSFCGVVYDPYQFSWTIKPKSYRKITEMDAWKNAVHLAIKIYNGDLWYDPTKGATHFYAHNLISPPQWAKYGVNKIVMNGHTYMKLKQRNS